MIYQTKTKFIRISPRKLRMVCPSLKDKNALHILEALAVDQSKTARLILKCLKSSVAAAKAKDALEDDLIIKNIFADEGPRLKRRLIKPRGRADLILKRMSHLTIILKDKRKKKKHLDQKSKI